MPQKAVVGGATTALAGAIVTIILSLANHPVSADLQSAMTTVVSAVLSGLAVYFTPHEGA